MLFFNAYNPAAASIPACLIPPPKIFLQRCASAMVSESPTSKEPTGAPKPFERQILSDPEEGLSLYFDHKAKGVKLENTRQVIRHIDKDIREYFKNYTVIYSKSM